MEVVRLEGGWTCDTFAVDGVWIVQVARSPYAAAMLRKQARVLPALAPRVPAAVPIPAWRAEEPPTMAYRLIDGVDCDRAPAAGWPEQLGRFLAALHAIPPAALGLPALDAGALREQARVDVARLHAVVAPRLAPAERVRAAAFVAALLDDDRHWRFEVGTVHGDLGPEHVLVSPAGDLVGVIDWEEVGAGDPVFDLAWWLHARPELGQRVLAARGALDDGARDRAALWFALMPWDEVEHGVLTGDDEEVEAGLAGVRARLP